MEAQIRQLKEYKVVRFLENDLNNLIVFLDRVEFKGLEEAQALFDILEKLNMATVEKEELENANK